jgi:hypothetical protein
MHQIRSNQASRLKATFREEVVIGVGTINGDRPHNKSTTSRTQRVQRYCHAIGVALTWMRRAV